MTQIAIATREHRLGNFAHAKTLYLDHLQTHSEDDEVWHALGILYAQCHSYEEASEAINKAIALNKTQSTYYNSLGNLHRQAHHYDDAIKAYKKAIKIHPNYPSAYNNLGNIYTTVKRYASAEEVYKKALALKPHYADAHCNLGILYLHLDKETLALEHLVTAHTLNPNLIAVNMQLGDYHLRHEAFSKARDFFKVCETNNPGDDEIQHRLGICDYHLKNWQTAINAFDQALLLNPSHPEAHQYLANIYLEKKEVDLAMQHYFRQLEKNPFFETYFNLGVLLMMKERFKEALLYFNEADKLQPNSFDIALNRGHIHLKRNEMSLAITAYQQALALNPDNDEIQHILAALTQQATPEKAPAAFVTHLFDQYAPYYDFHLSNRLSYETPNLLLNIIQTENPTFFDTPIHAIDLGCGTGLCGTVLRPHVKTLIGIDVSKEMLAIAEEKKCYDALVENDIETALKDYSSIDLILAADVFTYIGDLTTIFKAVTQALKPLGLFVFTVEKTFEADYILQPSVRYAHHKDYLERLIKENGLVLLRLENTRLRKQKDQWIEGYIVVITNG